MRYRTPDKVWMKENGGDVKKNTNKKVERSDALGFLSAQCVDRNDSGNQIMVRKKERRQIGERTCLLWLFLWCRDI